MKERLNKLIDSDNVTAYRELLELESICFESDELYDYIDTLIEMLNHEKTFVRVRGFRLICCLSKWDKDNIIDKNIDKILNTLDSNIGAEVRQCLGSINQILLYKPNLNSTVEKKLKSLDLTKYKDSMSPLIKKDVDKILNSL